MTRSACRPPLDNSNGARVKDPLQDDLPTFTTCFSVARETARKAVRVLRDQGLVQIVQGRGAFVTKASRPPRA